MTEHQAPWIESDGVTNLPTAPGLYSLYAPNMPIYEWFAYFDGHRFFNSSTSKDMAVDHYETNWYESAHHGFFTAWRDYQGLMIKPAIKDYQKEITASLMASNGSSLIGWVSSKRTEDDEEQAIFETWLNRECPSGDADQVQSAWLESDDYADMVDKNYKTPIDSCWTTIMASDEPGIQRAAYAAKYEAKQAGPTIIHGVTVDPVAFEAFLDSQRPKPIPNNTPRGIMAVWNERADHRFGMWNLRDD